MSEKVQQAIQLIKAGDKQEGRQILADVLARDPKNETAWLWMAGVVDSDEQRLYCVKEVLKINPSNQAAQQALDSLSRDQVEPSYSGGGRQAAATAPVEKPAEPIPAAPSTAAMPGDQELTEYVVRELGNHVEKREIIYKLAQVTGRSWSEVEAFVGEVEDSQQQRIARRRAPLLLIVGLITIAGGVALALPNVSLVMQFLRDPGANLLYTPYLVRRIIALVVGLGMVAGGILGILWAFMPPSKEAMEAAMGGERGRDESVDDLVDVGVWLDTSGSGDRHSGSRRRGRIRLL
jgi:hypothetical protein